MARLAIFRNAGFRAFYAGYLTSMIGSSMSVVAVAFAVLRTGAGASGLGVVIAARTAPQVLVVLAGGVAADRFGRRKVMIIADVTRFVAQAGFAAALFLGASQLWLFAIFAAAGGAAQGIFGPALSALTAELAPADELGNANALLGLAGSTARIAGPALAGLLVAVTSPAVVIAVDAASYGASVAALASLRGLPAISGDGARRRSALHDLREGWAQFRAHRWLLPSTLEFTVINLAVWSPFLLLGPVLSSQAAHGSVAWGAIMAAYGAGSVAGGLLALGRRPRQPLATSVIVTIGYGLPCAALALNAPLAVTAGAALLAGAASAISFALALTVVQQQVPASRLARVRSIQSLAAFSASPAGLLLTGPAACLFGIRAVLAFAAAASVIAVLATIAAPSVRRVSWLSPPGGGTPGAAQLPEPRPPRVAVGSAD